jgi:hypothetical protein
LLGAEGNVEFFLHLRTGNKQRAVGGTLSLDSIAMSAAPSNSPSNSPSREAGGTEPPVQQNGQR